MTDLTLRLLLASVLFTSVSHGQTGLLDSCGLDTNPKLNKFETEYLDKILFSDSTHDFKRGFTFADKSIYFFTCNATTSADNFINKEDFFNIIRTSGTRRPRGIFTLSEKQKHELGVVDAVVLIDCKAYSDRELIEKLKQRKSPKMN